MTEWDALIASCDAAGNVELAALLSGLRDTLDVGDDAQNTGEFAWYYQLGVQVAERYEEGPEQ